MQRFIVVWAVLSGLVMSFAPLLGGMMQATSWIPDGMAVVSSRSVFLYLLQLFFWLLPTVALAILLWRDRRRDASVEARLARAD